MIVAKNKFGDKFICCPSITFKDQFFFNFQKMEHALAFLLPFSSSSLAASKDNSYLRELLFFKSCLSSMVNARLSLGDSLDLPVSSSS